MPRIDFTYNVTEGWRINGADNVIFDGIDSSIDCINFIQVDLSTLHQVPTSSSTTLTSTSTNENLINNNKRSQCIHLLCLLSFILTSLLERRRSNDLVTENNEQLDNVNSDEEMNVDILTSPSHIPDKRKRRTDRSSSNQSQSSTSNNRMNLSVSNTIDQSSHNVVSHNDNNPTDESISTSKNEIKDKEKIMQTVSEAEERERGSEKKNEHKSAIKKIMKASRLQQQLHTKARSFSPFGMKTQAGFAIRKPARNRNEIKTVTTSEIPFDNGNNDNDNSFLPYVQTQYVREISQPIDNTEPDNKNESDKQQTQQQSQSIQQKSFSDNNFIPSKKADDKKISREDIMFDIDRNSSGKSTPNEIRRSYENKSSNENESSSLNMLSPNNKNVMSNENNAISQLQSNPQLHSQVESSHNPSSSQSSCIPSYFLSQDSQNNLTQTSKDTSQQPHSSFSQIQQPRSHHTSSYSQKTVHMPEPLSYNKRHTFNPHQPERAPNHFTTFQSSTNNRNTNLYNSSERRSSRRFSFTPRQVQPTITSRGDEIMTSNIILDSNDTSVNMQSLFNHDSNDHDIKPFKYNNKDSNNYNNRRGSTSKGSHHYRYNNEKKPQKYSDDPKFDEIWFKYEDRCVTKSELNLAGSTLITNEAVIGTTPPQKESLISIVGDYLLLFLRFKTDYRLHMVFPLSSVNEWKVSYNIIYTKHFIY